MENKAQLEKNAKLGEELISQHESLFAPIIRAAVTKLQEI